MPKVLVVGQRSLYSMLIQLSLPDAAELRLGSNMLVSYLHIGLRRKVFSASQS